MINFRCPKCNDWLSVAESLAGSRETCPNCGNVCIVTTPPGSTSDNNVPPSIGVEAELRVVPPEPRMPDLMTAGIAMYIAHFVLGLASGLFHGSPEISEENAAGLAQLGCLALILVPADIVGFIIACLGRAWGAILMTCATVIGWILGFAVITMGIGLNALDLLTNILGAASLVCFLVPSAWAYYRQSEAYRKSG